MPDAYVLIFLVILLAAAATYWIPAGSFTMREVTIGEGEGARVRQVIDPESFTIARDESGKAFKSTVSLFSGEAHGGTVRIHRFPADAKAEIGVFNYVFEGMTSGSKYGAAVGVVAFILIIGGAFGIILRTGAVEAGIHWVIARTRGRDLFLVPLLFLIFSLGGAVFGMSEEAIAFAMLLTPLLVRLGYDSITAVLVTYGATQIGFATSWMNPFNVGVAQGLAGVPLLSGLWFRLSLWSVFTLGTGLFVVLYARGIRRHPERSLARAGDLRAWATETPEEEAKNTFRPGHGVVLGLLGLGLAWIIYGVAVHQYYIPEIATQFFVIGVACGLAGMVFRLEKMTLNDLPRAFRKGAGDLLGAALIVGMAKGILLILGGDDPTTPSVLNTILHAAGQGIAPLSQEVSAVAMLAFQSGLNFFIPSGSGQAALTIPLMAPLADLAGVSRQIAVLAFQLGDGLTNLIIPTSASLMGTLAVARLDYLVWLRFMVRPQLVLLLAAIACMWIAVQTGLE
jgi:uncharacterized ion transporter superfamily protein YfcC